jgi:hypothetical protein
MRMAISMAEFLDIVLKEYCDADGSVSLLAYDDSGRQIALKEISHKRMHGGWKTIYRIQHDEIEKA